jgi:MinD superfamily P-loop ATPase
VIIAVASGKGGTGKTTIATSLARAVSPAQTVFLDCDVEAPNAHLFLEPALSLRQEVSLLIPQVDNKRCTACGKCAEVCQYHAIVLLAGETLVFPELCHGCGSCALNCPENAISEVPDAIGVLESGPTSCGIKFARGVLNVGEPMAVPVIRQLKNWLGAHNQPLTIRDVPPGTSCPVVESLLGADFTILVTEPTPFGLHDLKLAARLVKQLNQSAGVVINRDGIGDNRVEEFCREAGLPVMMRIRFDRRIAEALAQGKTLVETFPEFLPQFRELYSQILELVSGTRKVDSRAQIELNF